MSLGDRRHQEKRIKNRWRARLARARQVIERLGGAAAEGLDKWVMDQAARRAHHNKCDCSMCTGWDQLRQRAANRCERRAGRVQPHEVETETE